MIESGAYYEKLSCEWTENKKRRVTRFKQQINLICVVAAVQNSKIISKIQKAHAIFQLYLAIIAIKRP